MFKYLSLLLLLTPVIASSYNGWYSGPIEKAFQTAKKENKPLFLYWGAVWCPPCNHMKKTVFSKQEFSKAMENYIPVYLDGDTDRAQVWGEKLGSKGYPTMLVMNSSGKELMRMPTGLEANKYIQLLKEVTSADKNIEELAQLGISNKATNIQWKILSNYSWSQFPGKKGETYLVKLWGIAPELPMKSMLLIQYLSLYPPQKLSPSMIELLTKTLNSAELSYNSLEAISWSIPKLITEKLETQHISELQNALLNTIKKIRTKELDHSEQLMTLYPFVVFKQPAVDELVLSQVIDVDKKAKDPYSRQSAMSDAIYLLIETNQLKKAQEFALKELKVSASPFYFMSYLGKIEEQQGNKQKALGWYKKAWKEAKGDAAIFQWGTSYLIKAMELAPKDKNKITSDLKLLLTKVLKQEDAFQGRNLRRVEKLSTNLNQWAKETKAELPKVCIQALQRKACEKWFH